MVALSMWSAVALGRHFDDPRQLCLFSLEPGQRDRSRRRPAIQRLPTPKFTQFDLFMAMAKKHAKVKPEPLPVELRDDDGDDDPYVRVVVSASARPAPKTVAPRSVFDLAGVGLQWLSGTRAAGQGSSTYSQQKPIVERADGVTRNQGAQYPSNRWTEEREELERQRRARQKPPRPPKQRFKMKNSKVWSDEG